MNPFSFFLLLLVTVPVVEIYFLIQVGSMIGAFPTVLLIVFTAVLGAYLFKLQGMTTLQRVQASLSRGEIPALDMLEGVMLLLSAALLLTPGFVTDVLGFICLVPALRTRLALALLGSQFINSTTGSFQQTTDSDVIEGEFKREDDPEIDYKDTK
ncbi:MAG: FxsA family protein [Cycloclasticus sp.]|nr:FxsA family protein [Cycloclasticus sp.]MBQ0789934.1 FxsA family protein [Cycloclasticus sp.]